MVVALVLLACTGAIVAGSAGRVGVVALRTALALPLTDAPSLNGDFVTRRLQLPVTYPSAGRSFILHTQRDTATPLRKGAGKPLVLLLHGLYQTPETVENATAATSFSDTHGFTLVYPVGVNMAWNAGGCCRRDTANDVRYLVDLVHYVSTLTPVDLRRVYIWGFSNGGMMAWRAACQTRGIFAGVGAVSAALLVPCRVPVHAVDLRGATDRTVPFFGGHSTYTGTVFPDSANEGQRLARGSTLTQVVGRGLGHRWPPLRAGELDALNLLWEDMRTYRVAQPAISERV